MNKIKKVFLEKLPQKIYNGKQCIDWEKSIGYKINFIYNEINDEIQIVDYKRIGKTSYLFIKYLDGNSFKISTQSFIDCTLGGVLMKRTSNFKIKIDEKFKDNKRDIIITDREIQNR